MERPFHKDTAIPRMLAGSQENNVWRYLPVGVAQLDVDYRLVRANAMACQYLAILGTATVDESILSLGGMPIKTLLAPRSDDLPYEVVPTDLPNRVFTIRAQVLPVTEAGGWVLVIQEVTAERRQQDQWARQERLAAMEQLVAGIVNEFDNALCSIVGYAELLQMQGPESQALQDDLGAIAEWGHQGLKMARHLLDFSGQTVLRLRPHDLRLILKKLLPHLQRTLTDTIHMVFESAPGTYPINVDVPLCLQLLLNLTLNARDAMSEGGELCFALSRFVLYPDEPQPCPNMCHGEWVQLTVSDTGQGIPPEVQAHLFEPFFTTQTELRTGLGLTQVHSIMKQHDGHIAVESVVGHGTAFSLYFPSRSGKTDAMLRAISEEVPQGRGETVLVVDSNSSNREALRLTLHYLGYHVLTAANGREALARFESQADAIALVLSTLVPTACGGSKALVSALRQQHPQVKVMALVEASHWSARHDLLAQGANTCLRQPPALPLLAQAVRQALSSDDGSQS